MPRDFGKVSGSLGKEGKRSPQTPGSAPECGMGPCLASCALQGARLNRSCCLRLSICMVNARALLGPSSAGFGDSFRGQRPSAQRPSTLTVSVSMSQGGTVVCQQPRGSWHPLHLWTYPVPCRRVDSSAICSQFEELIEWRFACLLSRFNVC